MTEKKRRAKDHFPKLSDDRLTVWFNGTDLERYRAATKFVRSDKLAKKLKESILARGLEIPEEIEVDFITYTNDPQIP